MEDSKIIALYNARDEKAIAETDAKYGAHCRMIANNILQNREDTEECVNDTYLKVWRAIPPALPSSLRAFISRIVRNLALDRCRSKSRDKRVGNEVALSIDELCGCVSDTSDTQDEYTAKELSESLNRFLHTLSERDRDIFVARYYFFCSVSEIAGKLKMKENYVWNILSRTRKKLKVRLEKEGYMV